MARNASILKNSIFLFVRMVITLVVSLYTVRILLEVLGIVDYGIYNLIYGVVTGINFVSISLATAAQRFMSYDLGLNKYKKLNFTFSTVFNLFFILGFFVFCFMIMFGINILNKLNIPEARIDAALELLYITAGTFIFTLIVIPLNALIISYEKMSFFSYLTIFDVVAKLLVVYLLQAFKSDSLTLYGWFLFSISVVNFLLYAIYVKLVLKKVIYYFVIVRSGFWEIFNFFKWNLFGSLTTVANDQGVNIILNLFFGPAITGSRAIANRVVNVFSQLANTVFVAVSPQIVKSFATKDYKYTRQLVLSSSKLTLYLLLLVVIPLYFNLDFVLRLWLRTVSDDTIIFTQASLVFVLLSCLENPLTQLVRAHGNIKKYQLSVGILTLSIVPIAYLFFKAGAKPVMVLWVMNWVYFFALFIRVYFVNIYLPISMLSYIWQILLKTVIICCIPVILHFLLINNYLNTDISLGFRIIEFIVFNILFVTLVFFIGLESSEKERISNFIMQRFKS